MHYRFTESLTGPEIDYRPKDVIKDGDLPPDTIARCLAYGILVPIEQPPVKEKAVGRRKAEKAVL